MKKTLVALAVLAATSAFAQSSVSITGLADVGYRSLDGVESANGSRNDTNGIFQNGSATSTINIAVMEDLGGGLKANFRYELNADFVGGTGVAGVSQLGSAVVAGSTGGVHQSYAGISGGFGEIRAGRVNTSTLSAWGVASVFGTALGSGYGSAGQYARYGATATTVNFTAPTRFNNSIAYISPTFSGLTAQINYAPKVDSVIASGDQATNSTNRQGVVDYGVAYSNGPLNARFSSQKITEGAAYVDGNTNYGPAIDASQSHTLNTFAANYKLGGATVYGGMWTEKSTNATATDIAGRIFGVKYTMGAIDLLGSMAQTNDKSAANVDRKINGLGVDYNLSKRTAVYARYESRDANTNNSADTTAAGVTKTTAFGMRHSF